MVVFSKKPQPQLQQQQRDGSPSQPQPQPQPQPQQLKKKRRRHYHHYSYCALHHALTTCSIFILLRYSFLPSWRLLREQQQQQQQQQTNNYGYSLDGTTNHHHHPNKLILDHPLSDFVQRANPQQPNQEQQQEEEEEQEEESLTTQKSGGAVSSVPFEPKAWIVQGDSTPLLELLPDNNNNDLRIATTDWMNLMATINFRYAQQHNYGYTRFVFEDKEECIHPIYGPRHIAWCKLLTIAQLIVQQKKKTTSSSSSSLPASVKYVIWIDSDAMLQQHHQDIPALINSLELGCRTGCNTTECQQLKHNATLLIAANFPFCGEAPLTAFQIWNIQNGKSYFKILQDWWNSPLCGNEHPWEQRAFARDVYPHHALTSKIGILFADVNHPKRPEAELVQQYIRHVGHFATLNSVDVGRLQQAQNVAKYVQMKDVEYSRLVQELHAHHIEWLRVSQMKELAHLLWGGIDLTVEENETNKTNDCQYIVHGVIHPETHKIK